MCIAATTACNPTSTVNNQSHIPRSNDNWKLGVWFCAARWLASFMKKLHPNSQWGLKPKLMFKLGKIHACAKPHQGINSSLSRLFDSWRTPVTFAAKPRSAASCIAWWVLLCVTVLHMNIRHTAPPLSYGLDAVLTNHQLTNNLAWSGVVSQYHFGASAYQQMTITVEQN